MFQYGMRVSWFLAREKVPCLWMAPECAPAHIWPTSPGGGDAHTQTLIVGSWPRSNSEAMCPSKGYNWPIEVTASKKKTWAHKVLYMQRRTSLATLRTEVLSNSSVLVSCGPQQLPLYTALSGSSGYGASRPIGPAAWCRTGLKRVTLRLSTTLRTHFYFSCTGI